jgi:hypothetical protein
MWLFFPFGFISVVHKDGDPADVLCVRARDALSLDNVRARCPSLGPTLAGGGTDYPFRAYVDALDFGVFVGNYAASIDFSNFKAQTTREHSNAYHDACMAVWGAMHRISPPQPRPLRAWEQLPLDDRWGPWPDDTTPARPTIVRRRGKR